MYNWPYSPICPVQAVDSWRVRYPQVEKKSSRCSDREDMEQSSSRLYSGPLSLEAQKILAVLRAQSLHAARRNHNYSYNHRQGQSGHKHRISSLDLWQLIIKKRLHVMSQVKWFLVICLTDVYKNVCFHVSFSIFVIILYYIIISTQILISIFETSSIVAK